MIATTDISFAARDGYPLAGTWVRREDAGPAAPVVVIHSATAVPRRIYRPFATFLAARGAKVLTYDYRGIGGSKPETLVGFEARMRDWAALDAAAATDLAAREGGPLLAVGHSFGGQALGIMPGNERIARALTVAAQAGHWRLLGGHEKWRVKIIMSFVLPRLVKKIGYVPGKKLGLGEDLPKGVFEEWRGWIDRPRYYYGDPTLDLLANTASLRAPILAVGISDDRWATPPAIDMLHAGFVNAAVERRTITPTEAGVKRLGHFHLFKAEHQKTVWPGLTDWLLAGA